jgi:hypothetical protein
MSEVILLTEDGQRVALHSGSAKQLGILRTMLEMGGTTFPVPAVKSTILAKIVEFLDQHRDDSLLIPLQTTSPVRIVASSTEERTERGRGENGNADDDDDGDDDGDNVDDKLITKGTGPTASSSDSEDEYLYEEYLSSVTPWDQRFLESQDLPTLIELTKAANYLNIPLLLDLCCRTIARQMSGLKAEELRKKFNLPNDFTPEEEAKMAAEFAWIDE